MKPAVKEIDIDFSNFSSGLNTKDPQVGIGEHQVSSTQNAIFKEKQTERAPGWLGIKSTPVFGSADMRGLYVYKETDGTENMLGVAQDGKLYSINKSTGATTELYDMGGSGQAWFADYLGSCFVCNGTKLVKVEDSTTAYQVGIDKPAAGATSGQSATGGNFGDGTYKVYIGYARSVSGSNVLYSQGIALNDVVISSGTGTNKITISNFPNSSDGQVNNKVVWLTAADGSTYYLWHETDDNTTTSIDITDTAAQNVAQIYSVQAAANYVAGAAQFVFVFDDRLWYVIDNTVYYSYKASVTPYPLERFDTDANYIKLEYPCNGIFNIGYDLYFNTNQGVIIRPEADTTARDYIVDRRFNFKYFRTVQYWGNAVIGLTNDGVRIFSKSSSAEGSFSDFKYSKDIETEIEKIYTTASANLAPCGHVNRRDHRTEYLLSFVDNDSGTVTHNRTLVLNLDNIARYDNNKYKVPWEDWSIGFGYACTYHDGTSYYGQTVSGSGQVFGERTGSNSDLYIIDKNGSIISSNRAKRFYLKSKLVIPDIRGRCVWNFLEAFYSSFSDITITLTADNNYLNTDVRTAGAIVSSAGEYDNDAYEYDVALYATEVPEYRRIPLDRQTSGKTIYIEIEQEADDTSFKIIVLKLFGILKRSRYT